MNKYFIRIGEELLDRWGSDYIAFSPKSEQELLDTYEFMAAVSEALVDLYYEYGEDMLDGFLTLEIDKPISAVYDFEFNYDEPQWATWDNLDDVVREMFREIKNQNN